MHTHEFRPRIERLQTSLREADIGVAVVLEPRSQLYLTGIGLRGAVIVPAKAQPTHLVQLNVQRAHEESAIDDVRPSRGLSTVADVVTEKEPSVLGIETDVVPIEIGEQLQEELPDASFENVTPLILEHRRTKSTSEIERMERAAEISRKTFESVPDVFEEGMTELELKSMLQYVKRGAGAEDGMWSRAWDQHLDFGTLVAGSNTAVVSGHWVTMTGDGPSNAQPYGAGHYEITDGDVVVVDHQTVYEGYHCDEARTYVVGEPTERHREVYEILQNALEAVEEAIEPGVPVSDIYDAAHDVVSETPYAEGFMALDQVGFEYVGHNVGLNADESPLLTPWEETTLEPGMTFAVEPKILFEGEEGLTLEDTFVVTEDGSRRITQTTRELLTL